MRALIVSVGLSLFSAGLIAQPQGQEQEAAPPSERTPQMQQMQAHMQAMQAQMERIQNTQDPAERQRLMQEHMQSMHQGMMMMGRMMGGPMGMGPAGRMQQCPQADTECRIHEMQMGQQAMGQHMGMMQQMMEQMMQHMTLQGAEPDAHEGAPN